MWLLADRFVAEFTQSSASLGWKVDLVEDDEFVSFVRPISLQTQAGLGFDLSQRSYGLSLNPSISVKDSNVSQLFAQFFGFDRGPASVAATMSDLVRSAGQGSGVLWTASSAEEVSSVVLRIISDVELYGEPFFAAYKSTHDLIRHLEDVAKTNLELAQLAVAYALVNEMEKSGLVLSRLDAIAAEQSELLAGQTRKFISAYRLHFADDSAE